MNDGGVSVRIKQKRKEQRLTQQELADRVGVSLMTVLRWEKGERTPNTSVMNRLADSLNTSVAYLMGLQEDTGKVNKVEVPADEDERVGICSSLAYWGNVADNARLVATSGQNLGLIYSLLADAANTVKAAMNAQTVTA